MVSIEGEAAIGGGAACVVTSREEAADGKGSGIASRDGIAFRKGQGRRVRDSRAGTTGARVVLADILLQNSVMRSC